MIRNALIWLAVFATATIGDICWTRFNQTVAARQPVVAGFWSVAIGAMGSVNVIAYTNDRWALVPMLAGYFFGTWLAVKKTPANGNP
jgi:hypothetical protein